MTDGIEWVAPPLAGRAEPLARLEAAIGQAMSGEPRAVFVHGEAGVGKTRLVRAAADLAGERGFEVLWGRCVRFGAVESVLLPWVLALEGWLETATPADRQHVLAGVPGAAQLLPSLGGSRPGDLAWLLSVAESLLARIATLRPTLLVMDDVQWADAASRDALTYLVAGFGRQSQLVLATYRDEGLPPGDPLHGWLADLRRLPSVTQMRLPRLDREETEQQVASLLGRTPSPALVEDVQRRSAGNAYLTELLVQGVSPGSEALPEGLPADLTAALLAAWHRLSPATREAVRVLAVAGRPSPVARWVRACESRGLDGDSVGAALSEASVSGIVVRVGGESVWLRHPLLAEVLYGTYLPGESAPVHRAWAAGLASASASGAEEVRRLGDLALHAEQGGQVDAAFLASVAAADGARAARLWREEPVHLRRATRLWPDVSTSARGSLEESELLERTAIASVRVGQDREGVDAGQRALELARDAGDPVRTSRLTIWCAVQAWWLGEVEERSLEIGRAAVALVADLPDSAEYAEALAALSGDHGWRGEWVEAARLADEALAAAHRSGSAAALGEAYGARASLPHRVSTAESDEVESLRWAREAGDPDRLQWAAQGRVNGLLERGRLRPATEVAEAALATALESGALASVLWHAAMVAHLLADQGRLRDAARVVRIGLGTSGVGNGAAALRVSAMLLAVRRGDLPAAGLHLDRAREHIPTLELRPGLEAPPSLAEHLVALGRTQEAVDLLRRTMAAHSIDPRIADLMLLWGARASADLARACRDRHDRQGAREAARALEGLARTRDRMPGEPFTSQVADDPIMAAWRALRDAEVDRCMHGDASPRLWVRAVQRCRDAGLGWEEQRANQRWGVALLAAGASRAEAAAPLRAALRFAEDEGATRMQREIESWARAHRLPLEDPVDVAVPDQRRPPTGPLAELTPREREVLAHLVAGRTYAQIAKALFVTEKTISTHVSHVLSKTGTASRHEAAALALRLSQDAQ